MKESKLNINGLVLAGGYSTRMGMEKSRLKYSDKPQFEVVYQLLESFCDMVYISCKEGEKYPYPCIFDLKSLGEIGPIAGLFSAFDRQHTAWFVIAIDYPLLELKDVEMLVSKRNTSQKATVFFNPVSGYYEPYLGIYEKSFYTILKSEILNGHHSMQNILNQIQVQKVNPIDSARIKSIDTQNAYQSIKSKLK